MVICISPFPEAQVGRERARQVHEKEARRQALLASASRCFEFQRFEAITMAQVAAGAGFAKGTIYIYFKTKEELFLALVEDALMVWFEALDEALGAGREPIGPSEVANLVLGALAGLPRLPRLLGLLHGTLEEPLDYRTALRFREFLATRVLRTGRLLERRLPALRTGEGARLVLRIQALLIGLWPLAHPAKGVASLLEAPGLEVFRMDFDRELALLIQGLAIEVRPAQPGPD